MTAMKRILILLSLLAVASCHCRDHGTPEPRYRHILLRDFRTVYDGRVINYNIGTAAHGPATLNVLKKHLPADVDITIWASAPLDSTLSAMMERRFPEVRIVCGQYENPSEASPELRDAVAESDLFLVSSGSGIAVGPSLEQYRKHTSKPSGAYAIGYAGSEDKYLRGMDFAWFRDEISAGLAKKKDTTPSVTGWAPDAVFDFDCTDEAGAAGFMKAHGLSDRGFICCIPGFRYTPRWEFFGGHVNSKKQAKNDECLDRDNDILRRTIIETVRERGLKVLICAEQIPEVRLCKELVYDRLPEDVKPFCTYLESLWAPDLALSVYMHSLCVYGIEMHSQVMAAGNGVPAVVLRHSGFGNKSDMWNTIGLGEWLLDIDEDGASDRASAVIRSIIENPGAAEARLARAREIIDSAANEAVRRSFFICGENEIRTRETL